MPKNRIHQRSDGKYMYSATDQLGKRKKIVSRVNESYAEFQKRCNKLDEQLATMAGSKKLNFDSLFDLWTKNHLAGCSYSHRDTMTRTYENHVKPTIGHLMLTEITTNKVYNLLQGKVNEGHSKAYISKMRTSISAPFNYAIKAGLFNFNPTTNIRLSFKAKNERENTNRPLSDNELDSFFKEAKHTKYYNYFRLMLETGLRASECLAIQWGDIKTNTISINKAITLKGKSKGKSINAKRQIPITDNIKKILAKQQNNTIWLFPSANGEPSMDAINSCFKRIKRNLDFGITLYSLRHTFATRLARAGIKPKTLQYLLGHSKITITLDYYVGIEDEDLSIATDLISSIF